MKVCTKTRSPSASLPSITVKWPIHLLAQLTLQRPGILTLPVACSKEPQIKIEEKYRLLFRKQYHTLNHIIGLLERFE